MRRTAPPPLLHLCAAACVLAALLAGCSSTPKTSETPPATEAPVPRDASFVLPAHRLDAWNAVGQLVVRSNDIRLEGRAEMMDLHDVVYRGARLLVLTRALPLSDTVTVPTTRVTVLAKDGRELVSDEAAELLDRLHRDMPAEITRIRIVQAEEAAAKARAKTKPKKPAAKPKKR